MTFVLSYMEGVDVLGVFVCVFAVEHYFHLSLFGLVLGEFWEPGSLSAAYANETHLRLSLFIFRNTYDNNIGMKMAVVVLSILFSFFFAAIAQFSPPKYSVCHSKYFGYDGIVCVCSDEVHCDSFSECTPLSKGEYAVYTSSKSGDRFSLKTGKLKVVLN